MNLFIKCFRNRFVRISGIGCIILLALFGFYQKLFPYAVLLKADNDLAWASISTEEDLEKARQILQKPLKFFGYGSQCFAFLSEDGEYAVKICRASRYRTFFPSRAKRRKYNDFLSYTLALDRLPQQSQVVFIHLNRTNNLNTTLELVDPIGVSHFLKADNLAFYIQKKAVLLSDYLEGLSLSESRLLARRLLDLFKSCCEEGLQFRDIYPKNIGVDNGFPLWIDPGRITPKPSLREQQKQKKALHQFKSLLIPFLTPLSPDFSALLEEEFEASF
jgi:hypothetical protein